MCSEALPCVLPPYVLDLNATEPWRESSPACNFSAAPTSSKLGDDQGGRGQMKWLSSSTGTRARLHSPSPPLPPLGERSCPSMAPATRASPAFYRKMESAAEQRRRPRVEGVKPRREPRKRHVLGKGCWRKRPHLAPSLIYGLVWDMMGLRGAGNGCAARGPVCFQFG